MLLPRLSVVATGLAALAMYALHLPLVWWFGGRRIGPVWSPLVWRLAVTVVCGGVVIHLLAL